MSFVMAWIIWSSIGAVLSALVSLALNKWARERALINRLFIAIVAATLPALGAVAAIAARGTVWLSLDGFLIPLALQISMIVVVSAPIAWLISRRSRKAAPTDVFD